MGHAKNGHAGKEVMIVKITNEEMAYRLVKLYFDEIARFGVKRSLDLDSVMQAYYYTLERLENKAKGTGNC